MLSLVALAMLQTLASDPEATAVADVVVISRPMDYRLRVELTGADEAQDMIVSTDPGMYCGDERFRRTPGPYRQCWLRGFRGDPILLTAQHAGEFGRDWTIDWAGCTPQGDGRTCSAPISGEMQVQAAFRRL